MPGCNQQAARVRETLATVNFSPKGLINKANCTAAEETVPHAGGRLQHFRANPRFSVAGRSLNWKERKLPQESARKTTGRVAPLP